MIDIANDYFRKGYETTLIAGRLVVRDTKLEEGIRVKKIKRYDRSSNLSRLFSWFIGTLQIFAIVFFRYRRSHLLIVSNPPFAPLLPLILRNSYSLLIFDVFPDAFTEYGFAGQGSLLVKIWSWANRKVYEKASGLYTLSQGMGKALTKYVSHEKVRIVPLWIGNDFLKPVDKGKNPFVSKFGLSDKFVVLYSGNFGYAHQLDLILDLAAKIDDQKIMFVIIGGGPSESRLKQRVKTEDISNCIILPWQDVDVLPYSLSAADLSLVTLSEKASSLAIPSKVFSYMSVGSPILAITGSGSDLEDIIVTYNIGKSYMASQFDEIQEFIKQLARNPELQQLYHANSLKASERHTSNNVKYITELDV
jgi:glycosyltransferase involved in cell wall biosynthesis